MKERTRWQQPASRNPSILLIEIFILTVSTLSIFNLIFELLPIDQDVQKLLFIFDIAITPIFVFDFLYRLFNEQEVVNVSPDTLQAGLQEIKRIILEQEEYTTLLKKRLETIEGLLQGKIN